MSALIIAALSLVAQGPLDGVSAEATLYFEAGEQGLQAEESWSLRNLGSAAIPASAIVIQLPPELTQINAEGDASTGFEVASDNHSLRGTAPLPPGETRVVTVRYLLPLRSDQVTLSRVAPFSVGRWRLILEDQPGLSLASSEKVVRSLRELNGVKFTLWELTAIPAGKRVELVLSGLPSHSTVPLTLASVAALGVLVWAVLAVVRGPRRPVLAASGKTTGGRGAEPVTPLSGIARRERLIRAVELLDEDHAKGKLEAEQHARRRRALVTELAVVLRQIELESRALSTHRA